MAKKKERKYTSARDRAEKQSSGFSASYLKVPDDVQIFKPKAGPHLLDILPFVAGTGNPWADEGNIHWERTYYAHRGIGANGDTYICPRMTAKEPCPVCEHRLKVMKEGDEDNEDLIRDLAPKQRQLFKVRNLKDPDKGTQLWDISYFLFGKVMDARLRNSDEEDEWDKFFFLEDGLTLKIGFAEKSFGGSTFYEVETIDFKPRKTDYDDDILDEFCLDDILLVPTYKTLKEVFMEAKSGPKDKDDDDDEDDPPVKKKRKPPVDEDEDEAEALAAKKAAKKKAREEAEEAEEEAEAAAARKAAKKKKAAEADDDGEDDEEAAAAARKAKRKAKLAAAEAEAEEEEAAEIAAAKKARAKKKAAAADDDEDDDPPKGGKKKKEDDKSWDDFDDD